MSLDVARRPSPSSDSSRTRRLIRVFVSLVVVVAFVAGGYVLSQEFGNASGAGMFADDVGDGVDLHDVRSVDGGTWEAHWNVEDVESERALKQELASIVDSYANHVPGRDHTLRLVVHTRNGSSTAVLDGRDAVRYREGDLSWRDYFARAYEAVRRSRGVVPPVSGTP